MLFEHAVVGAMPDRKIDKTKTMSVHDKEYEANMAMLYKEESKQGVAGVMSWL